MREQVRQDIRPDAKPPRDWPFRVRLARPDDEEEIFRICRRLHHENALLPMSEVKVRDTIATATRQQGGIIGVIGDPGKIEGAICLSFVNIWYSEIPILQDKFNYVLPEYRNSKNAEELMTFAKAVALELDVLCVAGILSNERTEAKVRIYRRVFGQPAGAVFLVGGRTGEAHKFAEAN